MCKRIAPATLVAAMLLGSITARGADNFPLTAKPEVVDAERKRLEAQLQEREALNTHLAELS
ncbi:MAG: hypothetical protein IIB57_10305 [Planctomycetes bacterium]|nr:hypothetical protein [Planctomycetota bacterium]